MKRHNSEPTEASPAPASSAQDAPAPAKKPELPVAEFDGVRRSVFDLLKEKHPDLADPKGRKPGAPAAPPSPAATAAKKPEPARPEPAEPLEPPTELPKTESSKTVSPKTVSFKTGPVEAEVPKSEAPRRAELPAVAPPVKSQAPKEEPPRQEPPPAEKPRSEPPQREKPRQEPPKEPAKPRIADLANAKLGPPEAEKKPKPPAPSLKDRLRGWLAAMTPPKPAVPPARTEPAGASNPAAAAQPLPVKAPTLTELTRVEPATPPPARTEPAEPRGSSDKPALASTAKSSLDDMAPTVVLSSSPAFSAGSEAAQERLADGPPAASKPTPSAASAPEPAAPEPAAPQPAAPQPAAPQPAATSPMADEAPTRILPAAIVTSRPPLADAGTPGPIVRDVASADKPPAAIVEAKRAAEEAPTLALPPAVPPAPLAAAKPEAKRPETGLAERQEKLSPKVASLAPMAVKLPLAQTEPAAPMPPVLPKASRSRRLAGKSKKVALFWSGVAAVFALGTYALVSLKPAPAPVATAAVVPGDAAGEALSVRDLNLEPEKVVVKPPVAAKEPEKPAAKTADKPAPPKATPPKAEPKTPPKTATKPAPETKRERDAKKAAPKDESQILIETVGPIVPPVRTGGRQPEYPLEARAAGLEGTVVLNGVIGADGKVKNARVVRGLSPPLDAAALAAFRTWRFKPATQKGKRVEFKYNAGIEFRINAPAASTPQVAEAVSPAPPASSPASGPAPLAATSAVPPAAAPTAAPAGGPLAYGGNFTPPVRITMVWPQKPASAQMVKGEVKLQLAVGVDGLVSGVEVLEGLPQGVTEAAIEAVRQWKFKPARQSGTPVAVYHRVSLRF